MKDLQFEQPELQLQLVEVDDNTKQLERLLEKMNLVLDKIKTRKAKKLV